MFFPGLLASALLICSPSGATPQDDAPPQVSSPELIPVGVPRWAREVVIEGGRMEVLPPGLDTELILRIDSASPHGNAWRYDLEYYGLEPGRYNLIDFLRREDGSAKDGLAPLPVVIESHLPPGRVKPHPVRSGKTPTVGGYTALLWTLGILWVLGSVVWLILGRRRAAEERELQAAPPPTLAERLAPLVERGVAGTLPVQEQARLELMLIAIWRKRLGLEETRAAQAVATLKEHAEAGPLLRELERWLHSPEAHSDTDPAELLAPYRNLSTREWDEAAASLADANQAVDPSSRQEVL